MFEGKRGVDVVGRLEAVNVAMDFLHKLGLIETGAYAGFNFIFPDGGSPANFLDPFTFSKFYIDPLVKFGENINLKTDSAKRLALEAAIILSSSRALPDGRSLPSFIKKTPDEVITVMSIYFDSQKFEPQLPTITPVEEIAAGVRRRTGRTEKPRSTELKSIGWEYLHQEFEKNRVFMSRSSTLMTWMEDYAEHYRYLPNEGEGLELTNVVYRGNYQRLMQKARRAQLTPVVVAYPDYMIHDYSAQLAYAGRMIGDKVDVTVIPPHGRKIGYTRADRLTPHNFDQIRKPAGLPCSQELFFIDGQEFFESRRRAPLDQTPLSLPQFLVLRSLTAQVDKNIPTLTSDRTLGGNRVAITNMYTHDELVIQEFGSILPSNIRERLVY